MQAFTTQETGSTSSAVPAIDVHGHYGTYVREGLPELNGRFMTGDAATVAARARAANIEWTVVSPLSGLLPRGKANAARGNAEANVVVDQTPGFLQWVIVDPRQPETFAQARERMPEPRSMGLKIHPEEHCYAIGEHGAAIFEFAAQHGAVVLTHSGESNSLPDDFVPWADRFPEVRIILAHLGNSGAQGSAYDLQVRAIQRSRHGNLYVDTSSIKSIVPGLVEWAVREVGCGRVLFGTDTPLYFAASQRARIDQADLSLAEKRRILRENAEQLLPLGRLQATGV